MERNAVVAARRDRDAERDQLLGLDVERVGRERRLGERRKLLHYFGRADAQIPQIGAQPLGRRGPVRRLHGGLLCRFEVSAG